MIDRLQAFFLTRRDRLKSGTDTNLKLIGQQDILIFILSLISELIV